MSSAPPPTLGTAIATKMMQLASRGNVARAHYVLVDVTMAVLGLHRNGFGICEECSQESGVPWPCATVKVMAAALGLKDGDWR